VDTRIGEKPLFRVGGAVHTWNDVLDRARSIGVWAALEDDVRAGVAALSELEQRGEAPDEEDVQEAARAFRYERGLLAGDELDAWLDSRGLSREAWEAYLARMLARERAGDAEGAASVPAGVVWAEGICSGTLEAVAHELASLLAAAPEAAPERLDEELEAFCAAAATDAAIEREIESNKLHWIRVRYDAVAFADEDTAGEAALCVRVDGDPLAEVAKRIGADVDERDDWLDEVAPELQSRFFAVDEQGLIGPVAAGDTFVLAYVHSKAPPSAEDEDVRLRAAEALAERAVARAVNERVTWLEPL